MLSFIAQDNVGVQSTSSVTVKVAAEPAPVFTTPTPLSSSVTQIHTGSQYTHTVQASSPQGSNVSIAFASGIPAGAVHTPAIPTAGAHPATSTFSWTPTPADWGVKNLTYQATIAAAPSIFTSHSFTLVVNTPPAFATTPVSSVRAGELYTYNITVNDPDMPYGDALDILSINKPSWLTLIDNGNGTATISGTPTVTDAGMHTVQLRAEDIHHHGPQGHIDQQFTIQVVACTPTVITKNITLPLSSNGTATISPNDVDDGSTDNCGIQSITVTPSAFSCSDIGLQTVTLTVTNIYGVSSSQTAMVTVQDATAPTVVTRDLTIQLDANGQASVTAAQVNNGSADACGIATVVLDKTSFDCSNVGGNTVTLTVTDRKGNVATGTAKVTVQDNIAPTVEVRNINVELDVNGTVSITENQVNNGSYDNCGIASVELDQKVFTCNEVGDNTVTLTVTDVNGNVSTATANVTVQDNIAPVVLTKNIPIQLDNNGNATITPKMVDNGSSDACGIESIILDKESFSCENVGPNTVTLTVVDKNGNTASATAVVTVIDNANPIARTKNITVTLVGGVATITAADVDNDSWDACGIKSRTLNIYSFDCNDLGNNEVILTVTDNNNNVHTATATVNVVGVVPVPAITVSRTNTTYTGPNMEKTIFLGYGAQSLVLTASDAKNAGTTYSWSPTGFLSNATGAATTYSPDASQEGDRTIDVMATNQYGCTAATSVTLKVVDARCGGDMTKINMCHVAGNDATHLKTICIEGGSVADHLAKGCRIDACPDPGMVSIGSEPEHIAAGFTLKAMPNPSTAFFNLKLESSNLTDKVSLRVLDVQGRLVEARDNLQPNQTLRLGDAYRPGIYFIEVVQGIQKSSTKLIKNSH